MYPKRKRIVDPLLIERVRAIGICFMIGRGECSGGLTVHHIDTRGSGGDDVEDNLILLCGRHHLLAQVGIISKKEVRSFLSYSNRRRLLLRG